LWRARSGHISRFEPTKSGRTNTTPNVRKACADKPRKTVRSVDPKTLLPAGSDSNSGSNPHGLALARTTSFPCRMLNHWSGDAPTGPHGALNVEPVKGPVPRAIAAQREPQVDWRLQNALAVSCYLDGYRFPGPHRDSCEITQDLACVKYLD